MGDSPMGDSPMGDNGPADPAARKSIETPVQLYRVEQELNDARAVLIVMTHRNGLNAGVQRVKILRRNFTVPFHGVNQNSIWVSSTPQLYFPTIIGQRSSRDLQSVVNASSFNG